MDLILKAALGAGVVIILAMLAKTRNYYIAGLVPLFPTFALIAHYIVGKGRSIEDLKTTIVFGMWSIIPYFVYLAALYVLVDRMRLKPRWRWQRWPGSWPQPYWSASGSGSTDPKPAAPLTSLTPWPVPCIYPLTPAGLDPAGIEWGKADVEHSRSRFQPDGATRHR